MAWSSAVVGRRCVGLEHDRDAALEVEAELRASSPCDERDDDHRRPRRATMRTSEQRPGAAARPRQLSGVGRRRRRRLGRRGSSVGRGARRRPPSATVLDERAGRWRPGRPAPRCPARPRAGRLVVVEVDDRAEQPAGGHRPRRRPASAATSAWWAWSRCCCGQDEQTPTAATKVTASEERGGPMAGCGTRSRRLRSQHQTARPRAASSAKRARPRWPPASGRPGRASRPGCAASASRGAVGSPTASRWRR